MSSTFSTVQDAARLYKTRIDSDIRMQSTNMMSTRPTARPCNQFGKNAGATVAIEKWQKLTVDTTPINELLSMPLERSDINEVTVTVKEYGKGTSHTQKAADLAQYGLPEQVQQIVATNMAETMDKIVGVAYTGNDVFYTPLTATTGTYDTDGTVTATAGINIKAFHIRDIVKNMKVNNVPKYDGSHYLGIMSVFGLESLFEDTNTGGYVDLLKYEMPESLISGEIGAYFGVRFVEENNWTDGTIGPSAYLGDGIILGYDALVEAMACPEGIMFDDWDFDRFHAVAWSAITGFSITWNHATDGEHRAVYIHSAA